MKVHIFLLSFLISGQIFASSLLFFCPDDGPSGFWRNREVAWNYQLQGWQDYDYNHAKYGHGRQYLHNYANFNEALYYYRGLIQGDFRHCVDLNTEILNHEAKLALEKKKQEKEARLRAVENAFGEMKRVTNEILDTYTKLVDLYTHPQINPEYKLAIEALNKRIQALEEYKKTLEALTI